MISLRCLNPMCARAWTETPGFQKKLPKSMQGRCPWCGHGKCIPASEETRKR